jgi:hypothetical protein
VTNLTALLKRRASIQQVQLPGDCTIGATTFQSAPVSAFGVELAGRSRIG